MVWVFKGYSIKVTPPVAGQLLGTLLGGPRLDIMVRKVVLYCPDGTDPGIAANTDTVYVGPNKTHEFPLQPGAWTEMQDINPYDISMKCATANQVVFVQMGGGEKEPERR